MAQHLKNGYLTMLSLGNYGGFANALYQIAGILGIAKKNYLEPVFPPFINHCLRDQFGSKEDVDLAKYFVQELPLIPPGLHWNPERPQGWGYHDIVLPAGNWNISGHFQSWKYFDGVRDQLKHYFRMHDEFQTDACAIHARLGDYDNQYHPRLGMEYYGPAMAQFPPDQQFTIFSDDIDGAMAMFPREERIHYSMDRDYIQDFRFMKGHTHFIVGNSSYSAMAATLGDAPDKKVIAPRPWFGPKYTQIDGEDIYDKNWQVINWSIA